MSSTKTSIFLEDLQYFTDVSSQTSDRYIVYPSREAPRFIVSENNTAARRFIANLIASGWRTKRGGVCMAPFAGVALSLSNRIARGGPHSSIVDFVREQWSVLPYAQEAFEQSDVRMTKFCQHIGGPDTKVLLFITYKNRPLCVAKVMRDVRFDEKLRREKNAQEEAYGADVRAGARVYGAGTILGRDAYLEEIVEGVPMSRHEAEVHEEEIVRAVATFPVQGQVSSRALAEAITSFVPTESPHLVPLLQFLKHDTPLRTGLAHGDMGRPNILSTKNSFRIIDWERAGERPFHLIDAVYFMMRLRKITSVSEWQERAAKDFERYTGAVTGESTALYALLMCYQTFKRKYPDRYEAVVSAIQKLV